MILKPIASKLKTKLVIDFFLLMFSLFYSLNIVFYLLEPLFIDFGSIQKLGKVEISYSKLFSAGVYFH